MFLPYVLPPFLVCINLFPFTVVSLAVWNPLVLVLFDLLFSVLLSFVVSVVYTVVSTSSLPHQLLFFLLCEAKLPLPVG